jgi:hypothetical protein
MPLTEAGRREWLGEIDAIGKPLTDIERRYAKAYEAWRASESEYERMAWGKDQEGERG